MHRSRHNRKARWLPLLTLLLAGIASAGVPVMVDPGLSSPQQDYPLALEARTGRDYAGMLAYLRRAARQDNLEAQELLASVLLIGERLYGPKVRADACEAARWAWRSASRGSAVGAHQLVVLNGMRETSGGHAKCARQ